MTPPRLLLVDGTNIVMRCAYGGDVAVANAIPFAAALIERAVTRVAAGYLVVAFDPPGPSWRKLECPAYKAHRDDRPVDTSAYSAALRAELETRGIYCVAVPTFEADDVLATLAARTRHVDVVILSGDSDLLACCRDGVRVLQPASRGELHSMDEAAVIEKYGIPTAAALADYKALVGEPGDNISGVPGVGPKRATPLLARWGSLEAVIAHGEHAGRGDHAARVFQQREVARQALRLTTLRTDTPVPPIQPSVCVVRQAAGAAA